jgi:PPOX class probable F420-dependent enzyme
MTKRSIDSFAAMPRLPRSAVELIASGALAHVATIAPDGGPQLTMVWADVVGDEIWIASLSPRRKHGNVARDARVAVTWESPDRDELGMRYYLGVRGWARVAEGGARPFLRAMARRYLGPDARFPRGTTDQPGYIMRVTVERVHGYGPWTDSD